jgi:uncharacterized protein YbcI
MAISPDAPERDAMSPHAADGHGARREISRRIVALLKDGIGRGPTSARTFIHDDLVLVVLSDTLTRGEKVLAEDERVGLVREMRRAFLQTMRDEIVAVVTEETGRNVRGVLNDHAVDPDYAIGAFLLDGERRSMDGDGRAPADLTGNGHDARRTISRGMTTIYKDFIGRGPTNVRTYIDEDVIAVLLTETMTKVERSLASEDRGDSVREIRREFQNAIKEEAVALIEGATDHTIVAFLSDHSVDPDTAIEVFVMDGPLEENDEESLEERADTARAPAPDGEAG